ncbi:MAG: hypothetical protein A3G75_04470 [Verrucomicrobia bacterium RIFCSPLOWO2_12_FULL_64_8]|nr:MAG: hypothetical protein A3G75_04470 [Verrucomicrobia bacterium RIFCSPLOWO2_12_FULL_64_8]
MRTWATTVLQAVRCALAGGLMVATAGWLRARGWGDPNEGRPLLQSFTSGDYLTDGRIRSPAQDSQGVLYFGCHGLLRYDGTAWQFFPVEDNREVQALAIDDHDRIWVGGVGIIGYFDKDPTGNLIYTSLLAQLPSEHRSQLDIWAVEVTPQHVVFAARNKILRWNGQALQIWLVPETRRAFSQKINGMVYAILPDRGVWRIEADQPKLVFTAEFFGRLHPCNLKPLKDGAFLAVTAEGLARVERDKVTLLPGDCGPFIHDNILTCATEVDDQTLAIGTYRGGVALVNPQGDILKIIDGAAGLSDPAVCGLLLDREKNLWITTESMIARMESSSAVTLFDETSRLKGKSVRAVATQGGVLHVATLGGVFALKPRSEGKANAEFAPLPELNLSYTALLSHPQGLLSAGFRGIRTLRAEGTVAEIYRSPLDVNAMLASRRHSGRIYFTDQSSIGWLTEAKGQWQAFPRQASLPESPSSLAEDAQGNLWVGSEAKGVTRIAFDAGGAVSQVARFETGVQLPAGTGRVVVGALQHHVVLLTGAGVLAHNPVDDTFYSIEGMQNLKGLAISNPDTQDGVWIAAEAPLADGSRRPVLGRLSLDEHRRLRWQPRPIAGLPRVGTPGVLYYQEETAGLPVLWIGGTDGLLRVKLDELQDMSANFSTLLRAARSPAPDGRVDLPLFSRDRLRLPYTQNRLEFDFSAATYRDAQLVRYQTQLAGLERDWTQPSAKNYREFTNLSEGAYTFKVRAVNAAGRWSEPATFTFRILPPWYRTPWAYGLFGLAGVGLIYGGYRLRVSQMRARTSQLETLVKRRTEQLIRASAAKTEFIANMSHEIRNPLNGVIGLASLLQEAATSPRQQEMTASLRKCAEYLSTLVEDVLDFSKIEAGRITIDAQPFSVRAMVADITAIFSWQSQQRQMPLAVHIDPAFPEKVIGDEGKIKQIVINYVTNAFKYAGRGTVEIRVEGRFEPNGANEMTIEVRDEGPGVPYEEQSGLFEKFSRGRLAQQEKVQGTGLGLAVCRAYAEKMGGAVGLTSTPGRGAAFWFKLALPVPPAPIDGAAPAEHPHPHPPTTRALIVEDQEYNLLVIDNILQHLGYRNDHATNGHDALLKLRANLYDIVFMDWDIPGPNGVEVTRQFRQWEPPDRHTLVIATTAYSTPEKKRECLEAGMDGFAAKPLSPEKIKATIQNLSGPLRAGSSIQIRPAQEAPRKILDLSVIQYMADQQPERVRQLVEEFIATLDKDVALLVAAVKDCNTETTRRQAHRILSQTGLISATEVAAAAAAIQEAARHGDVDTSRTLLPAFEAEIVQLKKSLRSLTGTH